MLLMDDLNIIKSYNDIDESLEYHGTIVAENKFGFIVVFSIVLQVSSHITI